MGGSTGPTAPTRFRSLAGNDQGVDMADTVMMAVVGDCFPTDRFYANGLPLTEGFDRTLQQIQAMGLRFGNFEPPLSERGTPAEKLAAIRSHPSVAQDFNR